jgi:hypothetical protein
VLSASSSEWNEAWDVVSTVGAARQPLQSDTGAVFRTAADRSRAELPIMEAFRTRRLPRTLSVWILIGALGVSIGMIVSATIVTVAYLA